MSKNRESFKDIIKFFDDVAALVDELFDNELESPFVNAYFNPPTDIFETATKVFVVFEIPGVDKNDLHIAVGPTMVLIQGVKRPSASMQQGASFYNLDISYGIFKKRVYLPSRIVLNSVQVSLENGLLTMEFNKDKKAVRSIKIE
jgi:HSP20 family molecular chaperone IbpA